MKPCIHVQVRRDGFLVFERERPGEARSRVAWEEVPRLPTGDARPQVGGYRTAQRPGAERIVARRDDPSVGSFLLL